MAKRIYALLAALLMFSVLLQPEAKGAAAIKIYIDGKVLQTDQPSVAIEGYTFVPLRGIFEALNATVLWNQKAQTVTATKNGTTIVLKIGSRTATINNKVTSLDAPARSINGRTIVPVRFIGESFGDEVTWDSRSRSVVITTSGEQPGTDQVVAVSNVNANVTGLYGDSRDLQISFTPAQNQSNVDHYRILVVKESNASSFNLSKAQIVSSGNYTTVPAYNSSKTHSLSSQAKDVDGEFIRYNQAYKVFVLTVGNVSYALSGSSQSVTLNSSVNPATNVQISDVNNYGDGRDLSVSFTKAQNDSNISGYRVMIVKTRDAARFDLTAANAVTSAYYNTVSKTSSNTLTTVFNSTSRDTSGEYIKNDVAYTAFVLSVSSNSAVSLNKLSAASASVTLGNGAQTPVITNVVDVNNYGDGRDLQVSFNKAADESRISYYRIFVVRATDYSSFNLTEANNVSSGRYYDVYKTGNNINQTLSSSMRDVKGNYITNGVTYRVFVMGVSNNSSYYDSVLSLPSSSISLSNASVSAVTNLSVSDVSDYNDGRDLRVAFTKASDESNISHYRIFVVKAGDAGSFDLADANSSSYYTTVYKTDSNISQVLSSTARDVNGALITYGVSYRVFVLSVGGGNYYGANALSSYSSAITLNGNSVPAVSSLGVSDVSEYGDGRDLRVTFTKASSESNISHYRIFVVKSGNAGSFDLTDANNSNYYTTVYKTGGNIAQVLSSSARDVDGALIKNGVSYQVFVLSVANGYAGNALSAYSSAIMLSNSTSVPAVSNLSVSDVADNNNGQDLLVDFTKAFDESQISQYRIFVVKAGKASSFDLAAANAISNSSYFTTVNKTGGNISKALSSSGWDVEGEPIQNGVSYRVFVMSVAIANAGSNALISSPSTITLSDNISVPAVTNLSVSDVSDTNNAGDLLVSFTKASDESNINHYRVFVVKSTDVGSFNLAKARDISAMNQYTFVDTTGADLSVKLASNVQDVSGQDIRNDVSYQVFVMSVAIANYSGSHSLSAASSPIMLTNNMPIEPATEVNAIVDGITGNASDIKVSFKISATQQRVKDYKIIVVPAASSNAFLLEGANSAVANGYFMPVDPQPVNGVITEHLSSSLQDSGGQAVNGLNYKIFVLATAVGNTANALSGPSDIISQTP